MAVGKGKMATAANLVVVKDVVRIAKAQVVIPVHLVIECCQQARALTQNVVIIPARIGRMPVGSVAGLVQKSGPIGAIETASEQRSEPSVGKSARQRSRHFPHLATPAAQGSRFAVDPTGHAQLVLGVFGCALEDHVYRPAQRIRIHIGRERFCYLYPLGVV